MDFLVLGGGMILVPALVSIIKLDEVKQEILKLLEEKM